MVEASVGLGCGELDHNKKPIVERKVGSRAYKAELSPHTEAHPPAMRIPSCCRSESPGSKPWDVISRISRGLRLVRC